MVTGNGLMMWNYTQFNEFINEVVGTSRAL